MPKVLLVYGTRPEAIKMAPLIAALRTSGPLQPTVAVTGQHRAMLDQVNALFGIAPEHDLNILAPRQSLQDVTTRVLSGLGDVIARERPDLLVVQGDTTTAFAAALAAFYAKVPVAHLEAGLRTTDRYNPYPEEMNRRLTTQLTDIHLAPTATSRANLLRDGVDPTAVFVTGNTVIDALLNVASRTLKPNNPTLARLRDRRVVLVTTHRRESWGEPMARTATAVARLARRFPDTAFLLPAHLNPAVREILLPPLSGLHNVDITEPLAYGDFVAAMKISQVILTDSGGVQEEAPSLGKPVLVMRETTERPEAVSAGTVQLVGTDADLIVERVSNLLTNSEAYRSMARAINPYGDGHAAGRCVQAMQHFLGLAAPPHDFTPTN